MIFLYDRETIHNFLSINLYLPKHVRLSIAIGSCRGYLAVGAVVGNKAAGNRHGRSVGIAAGSCLTTARNWLNNLKEKNIYLKKINSVILSYKIYTSK